MYKTASTRRPEGIAREKDPPLIRQKDDAGWQLIPQLALAPPGHEETALLLFQESLLETRCQAD